MTFLILVIGVLVLRFGGDLRWLQRDGWFASWCRYLDGVEGLRRLRDLRSMLAVLMPVLGLAGLLWLLEGWLLGSPLFIVSLVLLLYSLGRGDLNAELDVYRAAVQRGDTQAAYRAAAPFNPSPDSNTAVDWPALQQELEAGLPYRFFDREFAVIFWFAVLGPVGALLYRLVRLRADQVALASVDRQLADPNSPEVGLDSSGGAQNLAGHVLDSPPRSDDCAFRLLGWLEWLPARLLVPSLAIVGNFTSVMQQARQLCWSNLPTPLLLAELIRAALVLERVDFEQVGGLELVCAIEYLLRRALVLWVLVVAVWVLLG